MPSGFFSYSKFPLTHSLGLLPVRYSCSRFRGVGLIACCSALNDSCAADGSRCMWNADFFLHVLFYCSPFKLVVAWGT
jgi:hypothetical protein